MSIYLTHNSKMLKADSARPGRYFGWIDNTGDLSGLLYLTYFTNNFVGSSSTYDSPVVRDNSIPLIQGVTSNLNPDASHDTIGSTHAGLPDTFNGLDCQNVKFNRHDTFGDESEYKACDTFDLPWALPFTGSDQWSVTFRGFYPTDQYISVWYYYDTDVDRYWLNPSVSLKGSNLFGTGNFDNERYPKKVLCTYKGSTEDNPNIWPTDFPGVTEYNGTSYDTFKDRTYEGLTPGSGYEPYPPAGRLFHSMENKKITSIDGDQWFYTVLCGHGDGTVSIYVNGLRILNVPFETITHLELYTGAKSFRGSVTYMNSMKDMKVTELSVWGKDLSLFDHAVVPNKMNPIYTKNSQGIYVPNGDY